MAKEKMRTEAVSDLVYNDIDTIINDHNNHGDHSYINDIMCGGFKGYDNLTNEELQEEYNETFGMKAEHDKTTFDPIVVVNDFYHCGSCEQEFEVLDDNACPYCGSGNWVEGWIDE